MRNEFKRGMICLLLLFFAFEGQVSSQGMYTDVDVQEWPEGYVILATGDTVYGSITYHCKEDIIKVIRDDGTVSSFSPVNVHYFVVTNTYTGFRQLFRTLYWNQGKDYSDFKKPTFFEQLNDGKLTLIMREVFIQRNANNVTEFSRYGKVYDSMSDPQGYFADEVKPLYYVLLPDGEIKTLKNVRKDLFRLFGNKSDQIKKYIRKNKLDFAQPNELTAIVNYYNTL